MPKGGYVILDIKGKNLVNLPIIKGAYAKIEGANGKPVLIQNFYYSGERPAFFGTPLVVGTEYYIPYYITPDLVRYIVVDSNNTVKMLEGAPTSNAIIMSEENINQEENV